MDLILQLVVFGISSSVGAELITKLNKFLNGSILAGKGADIVAGIVAAIFGLVTFIINPTVPVNAQNVALVLSAIYGTSQIFFKIIMKNLGMTVEPTASTISPTQN